MADESRIASTMVGAVLESTGYHYQQLVLEAFQSPFENEIGGLIYLIAIVMAILFTATRGGFQISAWLLIGPPLFFATVQVTEPIPNARWEFGDGARNQAQKDQALNRATGEAEAEAEVSQVFSKFVKMVSATSQAMVAEISKGRENSDKWFMIKAQLFANLHTAQISDPILLDLFHRSVVIDCSDAMFWAERVNDPLMRAADAEDPAQDAVRTQQEAAKVHFQPSIKVAKDRYDAAVKKQVALRPDTVKYLEQRLGGSFGQKNEFSEVQLSCANLWRIVVWLILQEASAHSDSLTRTAAQHGIPADVINNLFLQVSGATKDVPITFDAFNTGGDPTGGTIPRMSAADAEQVKRIIALYYLRNEANNPDRGAWIRWMAGRHEAPVIGTQMRGASAITERSRVSVLEWANKERLIHTAASLPYYQGLILYFLGATFPFFALLLLIPGKHGGFLLWFILWIWAKSWDFFFSIVMLLDDVLFALFAVQKQEIKHFKLLPETADANIGLAFSAIREMDPSFQLSTYYSLISVSMIAVPVASAQLFLGAMAQGTGLVAKGTRAFSDAFADSAHHHSVRDANIAMRAEGSALLAQSTHLQGRLKHLEAGIAIRRAQALSSGTLTEAQLATAGRSSQFHTEQGTGTAQQVDANMNAAKRELARSSGVAAGISKAALTTPFGESKAGVVDAVVRIGTIGMGEVTDKARADNIQKLQEAELDYVAARLAWFAVEDNIRDLHMKAAPLGILPLPPSGFYEEPSEKEIKIAHAHFSAEIKMQKAYLESAEVISKTILGEAQKLFHDKNIKSKEDLQRLAPAEKKKLATFLNENNLRWAVAAISASPSIFSGKANANMPENMEDFKNYVTNARIDALPYMFQAKESPFMSPMPEIEVEHYPRSVAPRDNVPVKRNEYTRYDGYDPEAEAAVQSNRPNLNYRGTQGPSE